MLGGGARRVKADGQDQAAITVVPGDAGGVPLGPYRTVEVRFRQVVGAPTGRLPRGTTGVEAGHAPWSRSHLQRASSIAAANWSEANLPPRSRRTSAMDFPRSTSPGRPSRYIKSS